MRIAHPSWPFAILASSSLSSSILASAQGTSNKDDSRNCYFPNGIQSSGSPCFPDRSVSPCCGPGFVCLSNGLCQPGPDTHRTYQYTIYRSACTDRTWNSTDCPKVCLGPDDNNDSGQGLATCGTGGSYCCGRGYDCCSNATLIFNYGTADIVTTIPYGGSSSSSTSSPTASTTASPSSSPSPSNNSLAIGIGVGVGVGGFAFLLAAIIAFLLFRRRRRLHRARKLPTDPTRPTADDETRGGSELPTQEMKDDGRAAAVTSPPPTYRSDSSYPQSPVSSGFGGMVPGAPLNPAEFPAGPERERFEMEGQGRGRRGQGQGQHGGPWKEGEGEVVRGEGQRQRHEMEA